MNIKKCQFTPQNIKFAITDNGILLVGNTDTREIYKVKRVKIFKIKPISTGKKVKIKFQANKEIKDYGTKQSSR